MSVVLNLMAELLDEDGDPVGSSGRYATGIRVSLNGHEVTVLTGADVVYRHGYAQEAESVALWWAGRLKNAT